MQFLPDRAVSLVSIHAPREGCDAHYGVDVPRGRGVSIHAPREGCDTLGRACIDPRTSFNSRTPGGVRLCPRPLWLSVDLFQFTHPGRGATGMPLMPIILLRFQFTHPGRGATAHVVNSLKRQPVSIHAPREGCDIHRGYCLFPSSEFQFTHPGRGATNRSDKGYPEDHVSIHAPREGCDYAETRDEVMALRFNSRTPGGVRLERVGKPPKARHVSIHAPREGCDCKISLLHLR